MNLNDSYSDIIHVYIVSIYFMNSTAVWNAGRQQCYQGNSRMTNQLQGTKSFSHCLFPLGFELKVLGLGQSPNLRTAIRLSLSDSWNYKYIQRNCGKRVLIVQKLGSK